jgi:hypothetical protein
VYVTSARFFAESAEAQVDDRAILNRISRALLAVVQLYQRFDYST